MRNVPPSAGDLRNLFVYENQEAFVRFVRDDLLVGRADKDPVRRGRLADAQASHPKIGGNLHSVEDPRPGLESLHVEFAVDVCVRPVQSVQCRISEVCNFLANYECRPALHLRLRRVQPDDRCCVILPLWNN